MVTTIWRRSVPVLLVALAASAHAQPPGSPGRWDYMDSCAVCHGPLGRGDGPLVPYLVTPPSDLTQLARRNGGVFPRDQLVTLIDGRSAADIGPHGSREMPVWGRAFVERYLQAGGAPQRAENSAQRRILDLVDHLEKLQR